jgi:hypothetical protein
MRKVGAVKGSSAPSPVPGSTSESGGGDAMRRTGSGGGGQSTDYMINHKAHIMQVHESHLFYLIEEMLLCLEMTATSLVLRIELLVGN